ncbi:MAG: phosphomannomutase CpsG [Psychromonas sp.]
MKGLNCFKTNDIRGRLGDELNEDIAYRIGRATGLFLKAKTIVVGGDVRETSESLKIALANGLQDEGVDVVDIGMVGAEEIYFAAQFLDVEGGIEVTASHNPIDYNGMKLVREQSKPISKNTGLREIQSLVEENNFKKVDLSKRGSYKKACTLAAYVSHLLSYIKPSNIKSLKLVVNSGNGAAGHVIDELEQRFLALSIPIEFIKIHHDADSSFPNGIPNPLLLENREDTANAVRLHQADMGIAWDGDFDRCFLFDETGMFIEGYYIVGLLAKAFLQKSPKAKIIHDPRLFWNTEQIVQQGGGTSVMSQTGHAVIKERMREENAIYGGEMSAHHYFRDFSYCDSGMIPWLLIAELLSVKSSKLSSMLKAQISAFPSSGEINLKLVDPAAAMHRVLNKYKEQAVDIDQTDGIGLSFKENQGEWRFNLRMSNTESLLRLNVESKGDVALMQEKTKALLKVLRAEKNQIMELIYDHQ